ncbi:carbohydrate sulfotransferase 12-like isoform X2 [Antennarius striatus]|uniref:carbohydrate sulfotransferase 12-like isoform X2 n=1 Tax=Antennarius striatus TaxID=241820 RepID=UPI0035B2B54A
MMAPWKIFSVLLVLLVILYFIMLSFDQMHMLQKMIAKTEPIHRLQKLRQKQLREMCDTIKKDWSYSIDDLSDGELANLIYDDKHHIIYCYVPKVACTNWKRLLYALRYGLSSDQDLVLISRRDAHDSKALRFLKDINKTEAKAKLKHYKKFLFVRDPFVRLVSAFRDKIQKYGKSFFERYIFLILNRYGNLSYTVETKEHAIASGVSPTFHNFVQYLIDPKTRKPFDEHWRPMYQLCHPCLIQYDFIGHQETLQEDTNQLLKILELEKWKFPPANQNVTAQDSMFNWFKPVLMEERRKLYELYEMDFKLFGYSKPVELLDG